ncbi:hypothetical protein KKH36_00970 [Patescibacteria group bacterium]|nr:hypothetical protein [Patescibacteria group bacterium]
MFKLKTDKRIFKTLIVFFLFSLFSTANAVDLENQDINLKFNPEFPTANESVTVNTEIYITDINQATISWFIDGILKSKGIGEKQFTFRTKDFGESTDLTIQISASDIGLVSKTFKITPAELDLIWETDTFTPPFYKGKALNTHQSIVKIVAFPNFINSNGIKINSKDLLYTWKKDWKISSKDSGYGRDSFSFVGPELYRENIISLEVETLDGSIKSKKNIVIKNNNPEILFYENNPLLGILNNRNLSYFPLNNKNSEELKITAYPLYFSMYNKEDIQYNWSINNKPAYGFENNITIRRKEGIIGSFPISLVINDLKKLLLSAKNSFNLNFE